MISERRPARAPSNDDTEGNGSAPAHPALTAALDLATRGLPVFPCKPRSKAPATEHGFEDASTEGGLLQRRLIAAGSDCNLAVATGGWGFVLEDDGPAARDWLGAMEERHGRLPNTWAVSTSPGRGHRYFLSKTPIPNVPKDKLAPDVEIKGVGGYVVCPPSIHPAGHAYKFVIGPEQMDQPAEAPRWLVELILTHQALKSNGQGPAPVVSAVIADGQRNQTLTSLAGTMRRRGMSESAITAALLHENAAR
jgi:putative DNA primase/helicase